MAIYETYKQLDCYRNLNEGHRACLDQLVRRYGEDLNASSNVGGALFTLHDFNHHCYDLYYIISNILCHVDVADNDNRRLTEHELFLLDIAVLLHDYGMSTKVNLKVNRKRHAQISAEFLRKEWVVTSSTLYTEGHRVCMSDNDIKAIAEIIKAHSDEKGADAPPQTGIFAPSLRPTMQCSAPTPVRVKFLAGILRLADELDITNNRIGDTRLADQLDSEKPSEKESQQHWMRLHYFSEIANDPDISDQLNLVLDDEEVQSAIQSGDEDSVIEAILNVYRKIQTELSMIQTEIFRKTDGSRAIIRIETVQIVSKLPIVNRLLESAKEKETPNHGEGLIVPPINDTICLSPVNPERPGESAESTEFQPGQGPMVLSASIKRDMDHLIKKKKLIKPGHFFMHNTLCARDWINTARLIETPVLFESCIQTIAQHIRKNIELDKTIILGIDLNGTLLGIRVAAALQCPFAFLVPPQEVKSSGGPDNETDISSFEHAVCITDVVVSGSTIKEVIGQRSLQSKLLGVYTLLYRRPQYAEMSLPLQLSCPIYCISDTFDIEVMKREACSWKDTVGCLACNKVVQ